MSVKLSLGCSALCCGAEGIIPKHSWFSLVKTQDNFPQLRKLSYTHKSPTWQKKHNDKLWDPKEKGFLLSPSQASHSRSYCVKSLSRKHRARLSVGFLTQAGNPAFKALELACARILALLLGTGRLLGSYLTSASIGLLSYKMGIMLVPAS